MSDKAQHKISFDEFEFDPVHRRLLRDRTPLSINAKTFDLLGFLLEHNGQMVTKNEILETVWADQIVEESNLSVQIAALRKALGEKKNLPRFLLTIPGKGYKFVADIQNGGEIFVERRSLPNVIVEERVGDHGPLKQAETSEARLPRPVFLVSSGVVLVFLALVAGFGLKYYNSAQADHAGGAPFAAAQVKQLTTKGKINNAVLSPDGKFYAYTLLEQGEYKNSLWLAQTEGSSEIQLRPSDVDKVIRGLAFSPDGKTLYFSLSGKGASQVGLHRMPIIGGVAEKLSDNVGEWFALSPNGERVAFFRRSRLKEGSVALVSVKVDGLDEREIVTRPRDENFSPFAPAWSPDGSTIAFGAVNNTVNQSGEIFSVRVADGHAERLTSQEWFEIVNVIWRHDGNGLIASAVAKSEPKHRHLWRIDYPAGTVSKISVDTGSYAQSLSRSSDGSKLLAVQLHRESNIWVAPFDDLSQARQITFSAINGFSGWHGFDWTADGRIVFSEGIDSGLALNVMNADGRDIKQITSSGSFDQRPTVTKDGRFILFRSNRGGGSEIWRVNADGGDLRQLTTGGGSNSAPHATPDGKRVVYTSTRDGKNFLSSISVDGGESIAIADKATIADPRVSPDGRLVAYGYKANDKSATQLAIVSIDGGEPLELFDVPSTANFTQSLRWTPDGQAICYRDWANGIWQQSIVGGSLERMGGLPEEKFYNFGWSTNGKLFAFTRGREIRDAVLFIYPTTN